MMSGLGGDQVSVVELGVQIVPESGADLVELDHLARLLRAEITRATCVIQSSSTCADVLRAAAVTRDLSL